MFCYVVAVAIIVRIIFRLRFMFYIQPVHYIEILFLNKDINGASTKLRSYKK